MKIIIFPLLFVLCKAPVAAENYKPTVIAFGACAHENKPQPIWDAVINSKPDLFIFAGDNMVVISVFILKKLGLNIGYFLYLRQI